MRRGSHRCAVAQGFTLIELVTVMVLVSALSVFAAPRMFNSAAFNARGLHDETLSYLRYAQKSAVAQRRIVCLAFTVNSVSLNISAVPGQGTCDTPLRGPTGNVPGTLKRNGDASYDAIPADFNFDGLGRPVGGDGAPLASQTLQVVGLDSAITVEAATGYVHD